MKHISRNKCKLGIQYLKRKVFGNLFFLETSTSVTNLNKTTISTVVSNSENLMARIFTLHYTSKTAIFANLDSVLINLLDLLVNLSTQRETTIDLFHTEFYGMNIGLRHLKCPSSIHFCFF